MKETKKQHESYGMVSISKFQGNGSQFFGSDLIHNNGVSITISGAEVVRKLGSEWYHSNEEIVTVHLSSNQFVDAITSGMNTSGVPCTIKSKEGSRVKQTTHVEDRKNIFKQDMLHTQETYMARIDEIMTLLEGNIGKRKKDEILHELKVLRSHIKSNTPYVLKTFNEAMEKTVIEAKHSISNYVDHKIHAFGLEGLRKELALKIEE